MAGDALNGTRGRAPKGPKGPQRAQTGLTMERGGFVRIERAPNLEAHLATSLATVLLAFTVSANLGLFSVDNGIIAEASSSPDLNGPSIVFDAGDGVATLGGAGELFCDKVNGCVRQDAVVALPAGLTGSGLVMFGGQDLEFGGQDLEFSDVSGLGTEFLLDAVRASRDGAAFDLFPNVATGVVCGVVAGEEVGVLANIVSPRDHASGLPTGFRVSDAGDSAGALPFAYGLDLHALGSSAGSTSADTFAVCAVWEDTRLASYAVISLRNGDSLADGPNRVTGVVTHAFLD